MTAEDFRDIALSMDGALEKSHMGHPDFRVEGRIFATLRADDEWGGLNLTPPEQKALMRLHDAFEPASGAWGRGGWTMVRLDRADRSAVRGAMTLAWQNTIEKGTRRRPLKAAKGAKPRRSR